MACSFRSGCCHLAVCQPSSFLTKALDREASRHREANASGSALQALSAEQTKGAKSPDQVPASEPLVDIMVPHVAPCRLALDSIYV